MATLRDIAKAACVSPVTVSRVLNKRPGCFASENTKQRIRQAAEQMGYSPNYFARSLQRRRSHLIGVAGNIFGIEITTAKLIGLTQTLGRHGYMPLFVDTYGEPEREMAAIRELCDKRVDGIIFEPGLGLEAVQQAVVPRGLPIVLITDRVRPEFPCVVVDRAAPFENAVGRLVELGHRKIGFRTNSFTAGAAKFQGYRRAMEARGIFDGDLATEGDVRPGATREFVLAHEAHFRAMTAIFASNDRLAAEIVSGLWRLGIRVPQDFSVVGYDDLEIATACEPPLTTFRQPRSEVSEHATNMVMELIAGSKVSDVILVPEWVERESTGPCRKSWPGNAGQERRAVCAR